MITPKEIKDINTIVCNSEDNTLGNSDCSSCLAPYSYYDTIEEQIASIVYNIAKNHYFVDGNKRTALAVFYKLCKNNGVKYNNKDKAIIMNKIASSKLDISKVVELLFK